MRRRVLRRLIWVYTVCSDLSVRIHTVNTVYKLWTRIRCTTRFDLQWFYFQIMTYAIMVKGNNTLSGETILKIGLPSFWEEVFYSHTFSERACCAGKQIWSHEICLPWQKWRIIYQLYLVPLNVRTFLRVIIFFTISQETPVGFHEKTLSSWANDVLESSRETTFVIFLITKKAVFVPHPRKNIHVLQILDWFTRK